MPGKGKALIAWFGGGIGVILIYSAYKNESPLSVIKGTLSGDSTRTPIERAADTLAFNGDTPSEWRDSVDTRAANIRSGAESYDLVPIGSQPNLKLDRGAAASFARVEAVYGRPIYLSGSFRTREQQAAGYAQNPGTHAPPGRSLHEKGLAVDVDTNKMNVNDPLLIAAFAINGWFRRGKIMADGKPEPWHWSYGVPG